MSPQDQQDYADAFNEDQAPAAEQSEDGAFGLLPDDAGGEGVANDGAPAVAIVIPDEAVPEAGAEVAPEGEGAVPAEGTVAEEAGEAPAEEQAEVAAGEGDALPVEEQSAADIQREKSWEGRLKKREAELAAREAELATKSSGEGEAKAGDVSDEAMQSALAKLSEDFGDEFVSLIATIATGMAQRVAAATADERTGGMSQNVEALIDEIRNVKERAHFERIYDAHDDFVEIANDPAFQAWCAEVPERQSIVEEGHAREIVKLLSEWKATKAAGEEGDEPAGEEQIEGDEGDGIRSGGGLRLPDAKPGAKGDYSDAWNEF